MKIMKTFVVLLALHLSVLGCSEANTANPWDKKLPFKTAIIEYSLTGMQNGKAVLYIKNYGKDRAKHTNAVTKMLFMKVDSSTIEFTTPDTFTTIDLKERTGAVVPNPLKKNREDFEKLTKSEKKTVVKNLDLLAQKGLDVFSPTGGLQKQEGEFLGHKVDMINMDGMVVWSLQGTDIPVKSSVNIMGMSTDVTATKITFDVDVPENMFVVPQGINIASNQYADEMSSQMAGSMVDLEALKDPKFEEKIDAFIAEMKREANKQQSMMGGMPQKAIPM